MTEITDQKMLLVRQMEKDQGNKLKRHEHVEATIVKTPLTLTSPTNCINNVSNYSPLKLAWPQTEIIARPSKREILPNTLQGHASF